MTTLHGKSKAMSHFVVRGESAIEMYNELYGHFSSQQSSYLSKLEAKRKLKSKAKTIHQGE